MAIVGWGIDILDPEILGGDLVIGKARVAFDVFCISPSAADEEDAGRGAVIAFFFEHGTGWNGVDTESPSEAAFSEASGDGAADALPSIAVFFVKGEGDLGGIPSGGEADDGLLGLGGEFEGGEVGGEKGDGENENFFEAHGGFWVIASEQ